MPETDSVSLWLQSFLEQPSCNWHMEWQVGHVLQWNHVCPHLTFTPTGPCPYLAVNYSTVSSTNHHKGLGVIMTSNFSWSKHNHLIITRAYRSLDLIYRSFSTILPPPNGNFTYPLSTYSWPTALASGAAVNWKTSTYLWEFKSVPQSPSWMTDHLTISLVWKLSNSSSRWCTFLS